MQDFKSKEVSLQSLIVLLVTCILFTDVKTFLEGMIVGVFFFLFSKCTNEAIGYGDSWIILSLGICLGIQKVLVLILGASVLTIIVSLFLYIGKRWNRKYTIPFVPFLTLAYIGVILL